MKAFVTDGNHRPALAITRSLGRKGIDVIVGDEGRASLASSSKYCVNRVAYPSPYRTPHAFDAFLRDFVEDQGVDVVMPVTDVTTYAVAANAHHLARTAAVAAPPLESFEIVSNKAKVVRHASVCGIQIPRTHIVEGTAGLDGVADRLEYPVVVKPAQSRIRFENSWLGTCVQYARSKRELAHIYRETPHLRSFTTLIQERIVGPGVGVFVLCRRGELMCAFAHRRLREKPPSGGVSVLCESVTLDKALRSQTERLLGLLGWHGVAMVEYKQDARTGRFYLMEINGRFWGSLQLAIDAGVDFPYLSFQLAAGMDLDLPRAYKVGVKSRWLLGDVDHLWLRLSRRGDDLPPGTPSRLSTALDFMKFSTPGLRYDVMSYDDPQPMVYEFHQYAKELAVSAGRRVRREIKRICRPQESAAPAIATPAASRSPHDGALG